MGERQAGQADGMTVDHLVARLEALERAFADLQRAYTELQGLARDRRRVPLVGDVRVDGPVPAGEAPVVEAGGPDMSPA